MSITICTRSGFVCVNCPFKEVDLRLATPRAVFFHLLRHRDEGHKVDKALLDSYDPEFDPDALPPHDPAKKGRGDLSRKAGPRGRILSGSYGTNPWKLVLPEKRGSVRGKLPRIRSGKAVGDR